MTLWRSAKRVLVGRPLETLHLESERLSKATGLAVLSSDALSSVAYAAEAMLLVLVTAGSAGVGHGLLVAGFILLLLAIVVVSYRQTVFAYPQGGGAYFVAKENLGTGFGLVAAAALLVDYTLTVTVSVAAGVAAITSAFPATAPHAVALGLLGADVLLHRHVRAHAPGGCGPPVRHVHGGHLTPEHRDRGHVVAPPQGLRVRMLGPHRRGGDFERHSGVPSARIEERRRGDDLDGRDPRRLLRGIDHHRAPVWRGAGGGPDGDFAARARRVRRRAAVFRRADFHRADPGARGQYRVRGFPAAGIDPRDRRIPAPPAGESRGPARLLERDPHAGAGRGRPARGVRGQHQRADPPLRRRCVRVVYAVAGGDGAPVPQGGRAAGGPPGGFVPGRVRHRRGRGDRARHQVHRRGLDLGPPDRSARLPVSRHQPALPLLRPPALDRGVAAVLARETPRGRACGRSVPEQDR